MNEQILETAAHQELRDSFFGKIPSPIIDAVILSLLASQSQPNLSRINSGIGVVDETVGPDDDQVEISRLRAYIAGGINSDLF